MYIERNETDVDYPYTIYSSWGRIYCDEDDLKELKILIEKILSMEE